MSLTLAIIAFAATALVLIRFVPLAQAELNRRDCMSPEELKDNGWHHR
jgi:hypothetical protein